MLRLNRVLILKFSAFLVVSMSVLLAALSMLSNSSVIWFGAGMLVATLYWLIVEVIPGVEYRRLRDAANAEAFTSAELRRLRSVGWTFVDCVEFHGFDVDHVAIGPGGVIAIETKWTNVSWTPHGRSIDNHWARKAIEQSLSNAHKIRALLAGNAKLRVEVAPVLMIWGVGRPTLNGALRDDCGVVIVTKAELGPYLTSLPPVLQPNEVRDVKRALDHFIAQRIEHEHRRSTVIKAAHNNA